MIQLGAKIEDKLTKAKGIAYSRAISIVGMVQYSLFPEDPDKVGDGNYIDENQLQVIGESDMVAEPIPDDVPDFLGCKVEDITSGFEGVATERYEYINGCVRFAVQPKMKSGDNKRPSALLIEYQLLKIIKKDWIKLEKIKKSDNGGPSRKATL